MTDREVEETHKLNGRVMAVIHAMVSADGKTLTAMYEDKVRGTTQKLIAHRQ